MPHEAVRLARRIRALDAELADNRTTLTKAVTAHAPELLKLTGVGPVVAATVLLTWPHTRTHPPQGRVRRSAGASPSHWSAWATTPRPAPTPPAAPPKAAHTQPQALKQEATLLHADQRTP